MTPSISALRDTDFSTASERAGVLISDSIQSVQFPIFTPAPVTVGGTDVAFDAPIDTSIRIRTSRLAIPKRSRLFVRSPNSRAVHAQFDPMESSTAFSERSHRIEINTAPVKLYFGVESAMEISTATVDGRDEVWIEFPSETEVAVGARSFHDRPAGTVTTTPDPVGAMDAISLLGSALKTTSPERSFPTLRGHPPLVELGDEFDAPEGVTRPDTGVRLELPADYQYVYPAASLAYYLGANVVPADTPRLVTDAGFEYDLDGPRGYETTVAQVLRQVFLLDCVTRTEGLYPDDVHEKRTVEETVSLNFENLYDQSLAERLEEYLSVAFESVADAVPVWPRTVDVVPISETVESLPFIADDLALVRTAIESESTPPDPPEFVDDFHRSPTEESEPLPDLDQALVTPEEVVWPSLDHARVGPGVAVSSHKLDVDARRRSLEQSTTDQPITIHVVCNDDEMAAEGEVADVYGVRDLIQFDVEMHEEISTSELRSLFSKPSDFLHYIGHVDAKGIQCRDGFLDARDVSDVRTKAFILNACQSFQQGVELVESGSLAGVVTMEEVSNRVAMKVGRAVARLLNAGFQLQTAMRIARQETMSGFRWLTVGDGTLSLCSPPSGCPLHVSVEQSGENFETIVQALPGATHGLGTIFNLHLGQTEEKYVAPMADSYRLSATELDRLLARERRMPVETKEGLVWSSETSSDELS
ncbi:hypothetical protein [Halorussus salinus]|uniref:hypothetical protein n=1 Tax=Halorussus salinus TaxID=1364935 RepID=UPI001092C8C6|nr:hypothetical protein [Halorussus salinus]